MVIAWFPESARRTGWRIGPSRRSTRCSPPAHAGILDREIEQLQRRIVVGEAASGFDDLAQRSVQRLDRVGGVDHLADAGREREERHDVLPAAARPPRSPDSACPIRPRTARAGRAPSRRRAPARIGLATPRTDTPTWRMPVAGVADATRLPYYDPFMGCGSEGTSVRRDTGWKLVGLGPWLCKNALLDLILAI